MKILVPIDGSEMSYSTLKAAKSLGEKFESELTVLMVIPNNATFEQIPFEGSGFPYSAEIKKANEDQANKVLEVAKEKIGEYPYGVRTVVKSGKASDEIIEFAEKEGMDLIVMGNRGLGAFSRTLLGSVSSKVINHSPVTVVVVK